MSGQIASVIAGGLILNSSAKEGLKAMNVSAFLYTLPYIVKGMVGIFLVTA